MNLKIIIRYMTCQCTHWRRRLTPAAAAPMSAAAAPATRKSTAAQASALLWRANLNNLRHHSLAPIDAVLAGTSLPRLPRDYDGLAAAARSRTARRRLCD